MVPINFRLLGSDICYIVDDSESAALIVQNDLVDCVIAAGSTTEPELPVAPEDTWAFMYTSGTGTGKILHRVLRDRLATKG